MAKTPKAPGSVFQALTLAAQQLARVHDPKPSKFVKGTTRVRFPPTEYTAGASRLALLERASKPDLVELARQASQTASARCASLGESLETLRAKRGDHEQRRRELAEAAQGYDWTMVHRDRGDFIGPLSLDHAPEGSRVLLGRLKLRALEYPSGAELFEAIKHERHRLEESARGLWPLLKERVLSLQVASGTATWSQIASALERPDTTFKKVEADTLFALVLLRSGAMEPGWSLSTKPPALAQQPGAITLPRIDKPGSPDRVFAIRIEGPGT